MRVLLIFVVAIMLILLYFCTKRSDVSHMLAMLDYDYDDVPSITYVPKNLSMHLRYLVAATQNPWVTSFSIPKGYRSKPTDKILTLYEYVDYDPEKRFKFRMSDDISKLSSDMRQVVIEFLALSNKIGIRCSDFDIVVDKIGRFYVVEFNI